MSHSSPDAQSYSANASAVFVSYGHKDASEFVVRLKKDLEQRGISPVWVDSDKIGPGQSWTIAIEQGIRNSSVLLALMTHHSMRPDSICQDEVALARTIGKQVLPVKVEQDVIPSLLLVRHSWIDFTDNYGEALQRLVDAIHGDAPLPLEPPLSLAAHRSPDFSLELARHQSRFVGRRWLFEQIDQWIGSATQGFCLVLGEPGIGKSSIAAQLALRETCLAIHFCSAYNTDSLSPMSFVSNLVASLAVRLPAYGTAVRERRPGDARPDAQSAFRELVVDPCRVISAPDQPQLLVVDALNEALVGGGKTIVDLLAHYAADLPRWLRIVATSRPEVDVTHRLRTPTTITIPATSPENLSDVAAFAANALGDLTPQAIDAVTSRSNGNFLVAQGYAKALREGSMTPDALRRLPPGIQAWYAEEFRSFAPDVSQFLTEWAPLLRLLVAAAAPLPLSLVSRALGCEKGRTRHKLLALGSLALCRHTDSTAYWSFFHQSLTEWLTDPEAAGYYWCDPDQGLEELLSAMNSEDMAIREYSLRWKIRHLVAAQEIQQARSLLKDPVFVMAKLEAGMLASLQDDVDYVVKAGPVPDRFLLSFHAGLRQNAHLLTPLQPPGSVSRTFISRVANRADLKALSHAIRQQAPEPALEPACPLTDLAPAALIQTITDRQRSLTQILWTPDGHHVVSTSRDGTSRFWDPDTGSEAKSIETAALTVALAPDSSWLVTSNGNPFTAISSSSHASIRDATTGAEIFRFPERVDSAVISPDSTWLASTGWNHDIQIWSHSGEHLRTLAGHAGGVTAISIAPNGQWMATASWDGTLRVWDPTEGTELQCHELDAGVITSMSISPDGQVVATTISNPEGQSPDLPSVYLHDATDLAQRKPLRGQAGRSSAVTISSDGEHIAVSSRNTVHLWSMTSDKAPHALSDHAGTIISVAFSPDGSRVATADSEGIIRIWDAREGRQPRHPASHKALTTIAMAPDGATLVAAGSDGRVRLFRSKDRELLWERSDHADWVNHVAFSPDGTRVVSCSNDTTVRMFDAQSGHPRGVIKTGSQGGWLNTVAIAPDGAWMVTGDYSDTVRVWDCTTLEPLQELVGHGAPITSVVVDPDGAWIATSSLDDTVRIWNTSTWLQTHRLAVIGASCLDVSPTGDTLAISRLDGSVDIWNPFDGQPRVAIGTHDRAATGVAFSSDGKWIASCGSDGTIRTWATDDGKPLTALRFDTPIRALDTVGTRIAAVGGRHIHVLDHQLGTASQPLP